MICDDPDENIDLEWIFHTRHPRFLAVINDKPIEGLDCMSHNNIEWICVALWMDQPVDDGEKELMQACARLAAYSDKLAQMDEEEDSVWAEDDSLGPWFDFVADVYDVFGKNNIVFRRWDDHPDANAVHVGICYPESDNVVGAFGEKQEGGFESSVNIDEMVATHLFRRERTKNVCGGR